MCTLAASLPCVRGSAEDPDPPHTNRHTHACAPSHSPSPPPHSHQLPAEQQPWADSTLIGISFTFMQTAQLVTSFAM